MDILGSRPWYARIAANAARRLPLSVLAVAAACAAGPACTRGDAPSTAALERRFPEHAAEVTRRGAGFASAKEGFVTRTQKPSARWRQRDLSVALPAEGSDAVRVGLRRGFEVRVREIGAYGAGFPAGRSIAYRRDGGASYWTAARDGSSVEEWLHLDAGIAKRGEVVATWEVEGGTLRQRGAMIEVLDGAGKARLRVTSPRAYGLRGKILDAELRAHGASIDLYVDGGGEPVLVDPQWVSTASMAYARAYHTSTTLPAGSPLGGQALVVGGDDGFSSLGTCELYDPVQETFTGTAGDLHFPRSHHTATLLANGKVLVAGGVDDLFVPLATAEIFDPATGKWAVVTNMSSPRIDFTATLLADGKVLAIGGDNKGPLATAEVYDPVADTWTSKAVMNVGRELHTATRLANGKVLVTGGYSSLAPADQTAEVYDPALDGWHIVQAPMGWGRQAHTATLLADGTVLIAGGLDPTYGISGAELYDPAIDFWIPVQSMYSSRGFHTATTLLDGSVLVTGGFDGSGGYGYGPNKGFFGGGYGGGNGYSLADTEAYDPVTQSWYDMGYLNYGRAAHAASAFPSGTVVVTGGDDGTGYIETADDVLQGDPNGSFCDAASTCASGFCVDGVCCDTACTGACVSCSAAIKGQGGDGFCGPVTAGTNPEGDCVKASPGKCGSTGVCDGFGACEVIPNGTDCNDGDACTQTDRCLAGACVGTNLVLCPSDPCKFTSACDHVTGTCTVSSVADGAPCEGGICVAGLCIEDPKVGTGTTSSVGATGTTGSGGAGGSSATGGAPPSSGGAGGNGNAGGSGTNPETSEGIRLIGGCVCATGRGDTGGAPTGWLGLGLGLLALRRRRGARRAGSVTEASR